MSDGWKLYRQMGESLRLEMNDVNAPLPLTDEGKKFLNENIWRMKKRPVRKKKPPIPELLKKGIVTRIMGQEEVSEVWVEEFVGWFRFRELERLGVGACGEKGKSRVGTVGSVDTELEECDGGIGVDAFRLNVLGDYFVDEGYCSGEDEGAGKGKEKDVGGPIENHELFGLDLGQRTDLESDTNVYSFSSTY
ncbi:MAG: hypothetical protein MMC33_001405 [Icmadophila ericetorum]|nr:hypothetical protein [Icmadophila ericetorum]